MSVRKRILVFPCGSEIGLEIHRSLRYSTHFELVGGSSVDDHGRFVYETYVPNIPFHDASDFAFRIAEIVRQHGIDAIYPSMDAVAETLQAMAGALPCRVIGSPTSTTSICASKAATYDLLAAHIPVPKRYATLETVPAFPIFIKPDRGYGSRLTTCANTADTARAFLAGLRTQMLLLEYLPGREWTVDCFTDRHGQLLFHGTRGRNRISNGISVNTAPTNEFASEFSDWAATINHLLKPRGAWFFQAKAGNDGLPRLLEVAARLGGSSGAFRCQGVNFAMLSAFDAFDQDVCVSPNGYHIELDRALSNRYRLAIHYQHVYVDLDDCLLIDGRLNYQLLAFLYQAIAEGKGITLLTRHYRHPETTLREQRIGELFDRIIHLDRDVRKSAYIDHRDAIFIDDSFAERQEVASRTGIPVFSPDMVEALL